MKIRDRNTLLVVINEQGPGGQKIRYFLYRPVMIFKYFNQLRCSEFGRDKSMDKVRVVVYRHSSEKE